MEIRLGEGGGGSFALEIQAGGGSNYSGNPGRGLKTTPSIGGGWILSGIAQ